MNNPRPQPSPVRCNDGIWQVLAGVGDSQHWEDCLSEEDAQVLSRAELWYWELHSAPATSEVIDRLNQLADVLERHAVDLGIRSFDGVAADGQVQLDCTL